jgi:hypothetical protein
MPLLNDICRCHSRECPARETCRRWIERKTGAAHADLYHHQQTPCPAYIQKERKQ